MRRLWAYIVLAFTSLTLIATTLNPVFAKVNSNIEYQQGREIVFRVSNKEDTKTTINPLEETDDGRPVDIIAEEMENRLENCDISLYQIETEGDDTIRVTLSEEYSSNYDNIIIYLTFNGELGLTNGVNDVALGENFLTDEEAYVDTVNGYPSIIFPVNVDDSYYKAVLEGVEKAKEEGKGSEKSSTTNEDGESEETDVWYLYLWYDFDEEVCLFENREDEDVSRRLLNKFQYPDNQEDLYYPDDDLDKLCFAASISGDTVEDKRVAYENARFYANLINASKLDYKVTYMYDQTVDAWAENVINLGGVSDSIAFKQTAIATLISIVVVCCFLAISHKIGALSICLSTLVTLYLSLASIAYLSAEFSTFAVIGLIIVTIASIASGCIYMAKFKEEAYKGRSLKKCNLEAAKKSILPIVDINAVLMIVGAFGYLLGGTLMKSFAAVTFVGGLISMIVNLIYLRIMMWLLANNTKFQGKYNLFGIDPANVPNMLKEEKQSYFGAYADKDFTKNHKKVGGVVIAAVAVCCIGMGVFGGLNDGEIYRKGSTASNAAIYIETINENSLAMKDDFITNQVIANLYTYETDESEAVALKSLVAESFYKTYSEMIDGETVDRYAYIIKLNSALSADNQVFYKNGDTKSNAYALSSLSELFSEDYKNTYQDLGLSVDSRLVVSFKEGTVVNNSQPDVLKVILATCVGTVVACIYLSLRYRLSRGIATMMLACGTSLISVGLYSLLRFASMNYISAAMPFVAILAMILSIIFNNREKEMINEDRNREKTDEYKNAMMIKATSNAFPIAYLVAAIATFISIAFFSFGPYAYMNVYAVMAWSAILVTFVVLALNGRLSIHLAKKFKRTATRERKHKKVVKTIQPKSAEPEEATFIGIND